MGCGASTSAAASNAPTPAPAAEPVTCAVEVKAKEHPHADGKSQNQWVHGNDLNVTQTEYSTVRRVHVRCLHGMLLALHACTGSVDMTALPPCKACVLAEDKAEHNCVHMLD